MNLTLLAVLGVAALGLILGILLWLGARLKAAHRAGENRLRKEVAEEALRILREREHVEEEVRSLPDADLDERLRRRARD